MRPTAFALLCIGCAPAPIVSPLDVGPDRPEYLVNPSDRSDNIGDVQIATDASSADTLDASSADTLDASSADASSADASSADASSADASSADASSADARAADARAADVPDARPLMCPRGFDFDTCPAGPAQPCCAVDARTTIPLGCGCLTAPFECTPRGRTGCP